MKAKHSRLIFVLGSLVVMGLSAALVLNALSDTIIYFYTPSQLAEKQAGPDFNAARALRVGGLVKTGSVKNLSTGGIRFTITDLTHEVKVTYHGLVPSLFRDGQGVVAQGKLNNAGELQAITILAKHDEGYMPTAVKDALKASGRWREGDAYGKPTL
jgi:cytochrome c-type biogenesis protein CcmE